MTRGNALLINVVELRRSVGDQKKVSVDVELEEIAPIMGGDDFTDRATTPNRTDITLGVIFIVLLIEATRRTIGWIVPFIALLFIAYAMAGPWSACIAIVTVVGLVVWSASRGGVDPV